MDRAELIKEIYDWFSVGENYSIVHFAIEHNMSKEELMRVCTEDEELKKALEYAMSVQEYKVAEGAITGTLDRSVAIKMLETYNGWVKEDRDRNIGAVFAQIGESKLGIVLGRGDNKDSGASTDVNTGSRLE